MAILGKAQGVFQLSNSDMAVGSFLSKEDIKNFLGVNDADLSVLKFRDIDGVLAIDERKVQKAWYSGQINNAPQVEWSSLDEFLLLSIVNEALPGCEIERQIKVKRFKMDLKITYEGKLYLLNLTAPVILLFRGMAHLSTNHLEKRR